MVFSLTEQVLFLIPFLIKKNEQDFNMNSVIIVHEKSNEN